MTKEELMRGCQGTDGLDEIIATIDPPALLVMPIELESATWTVVRGATPRSGTIVIEESRDLRHFQFEEAVRWHWLGDDPSTE